jgi:photosystem II stability/assembly factor-like uncharacterized protein
MQTARCHRAHLDMNSKFLLSSLVLSAFALSACGLPLGAVATAATNPPATPLSSLAPQLSSTQTPVPSSGQAYSISELHMFDAKHGWAWASAATGPDHLLLTSDGGETWSDRTPSAASNSRAGGFFLDAQRAWLSTFDQTSGSSGLLRTTDGGKSWTAFTQAPAPDANYHFLNPIDGYAETADVGAGNAYIRVFESMDGGMTWNPVLINSPQPDASLPPGVIHLCNICGDALSYYPPSTVILTYGDLASDPGGAVRLSITKDLGKSWLNSKLPLPSSKLAAGLIEPSAPVFFDGLHGLLPAISMKQNAAGTFDFQFLFIYSTTDGGLTWSLKPGLVPNVTLLRSQIVWVSPRDAFVPCGHDLCVTHDGALSWQFVTPNIDLGAEGTDRYLIQTAFVDVSTGWMVIAQKDTNILYKTTDGGSTWNEVPLKIVP